MAIESEGLAENQLLEEARHEGCSMVAPEPLKRGWRTSWIGPAVAALLLLAGAASCAAASCAAAAALSRERRLPAHPRLLEYREVEEEEEEEEEDDSACGIIQQDREYRGQELYNVSMATTADACCARCQEDPQCRMWTLTDHSVCKLMTLLPSEMRTLSDITDRSVEKPGYLSGLPFQMPADTYHGYMRQGSLFCFALMRPRTYEQELLVMQRRQHTSIFACDEYSVYSSEEIMLHPGLKTSVVDSDLKCETGGEFGTALNNDIFLAVWDKVFKDGRYRYHDWSVKVDPDSVFFPQRLRVAVQFHPDEGAGIYLNNCKFGLHGPIEVLSRIAVEAWEAGIPTCSKHFDQLCSGPCLWGEDMWIDQCLDKVLKIKRDDDWNLIAEDHCASDDWKECKNGRVTFHPFKTVSSYEACLKNASYGALPKLVELV